jgi:hypothetical protein
MFGTRTSWASMGLSVALLFPTACAERFMLNGSLQVTWCCHVVLSRGAVTWGCHVVLSVQLGPAAVTEECRPEGCST